MTIEIMAPVTKEKFQQAIEQLNKETGKKSLKKYFGKLKKIDGLSYQNQVRIEWIYFCCRYDFLIAYHHLLHNPKSGSLLKFR